MPFKSRRPKLNLSKADQTMLEQISRSRTEPLRRVERARILLAYNQGETISAIARELGISRPTVERCVKKALEMGAIAALEDLPRPGRPPTLTPEAKAWLLSCACQKPKDLGYAQELWTTRLLAEHARTHGPKAGHECLAKLSRGTVSKILSRAKIRPHKITYYLDKRDKDFDEKMAQVLCVYQEVAWARARGESGAEMLTAWISYDEKPGIQAIGTVAPDRLPVVGEHATVGRDPEYVRHGTLSLLAGIDLHSGKVWGIVRERHRSREFIEFLKMLDANYPPGVKLRIILDNHSSHTSKETRAYLETVPNRFEFVFTPKHGSWLNLIEAFFSKLTRVLLRGMRVGSKEELGRRILQYLEEVNAAPVVYRWRHKMEELSVV